MSLREQYAKSERLLRADPHIKEIEWDERHVPSVSVYLWRSGTMPAAERDLGKMRNFLESPYIIDTFTDHEKRRAWKKTLEGSPQIELLNLNALRANNLTKVMGGLYLICVGYEGTESDKLRKLVRTAYESIPRGEEAKVYGVLAPEKKRTKVRTIKDNVETVMKFLSEQVAR